MSDFDAKLDLKTILQTEGQFVGTTAGVSMRPMIKSGRDVIVVKKKTEQLKKYDVALYTRGDAYVLHRVLEVFPDHYIIRGDNCYSDEYIPEENVIGVLTEYFKGEKRILVTDKKYLRYVKRRIKFYPVRRFRVRVTSKIKRVVKKVLLRK